MSLYRYIGLILIIIFGEASANEKIFGLLTKNNCAACHSVDTKTLGPSYRNISDIYHMSGYDITEESVRLRTKLKNGGRMPPKKILSGLYSYNGICPPARNMNDEEIKLVVDWILNLRR